MQLQSVELPPMKNSILAMLWSTLIFCRQVGSGKLSIRNAQKCFSLVAAEIPNVPKSAQEFCRILFYCLGKLLLEKSVTGEVSVGEISGWGNCR